MPAPSTPLLEEVVVGSGLDPFGQNYFDQYQFDTAQNYEPPADNQQAFAPPEPVFLPEVVVEPPVIAPVATRVGQIILEAIPWLAVLVPGAMGAAGTGDAPTESSTVAARGNPPPPPPPIEPAMDDFNPPNWLELANEFVDPFPTPRGVPDISNWLRISERLYDLLNPPAPPVELPEGMKFFDVSPPPVTNPSTTWWSFPDVGIEPELEPFPAGPGPGSAPAPLSPPGIDPAFDDPFVDPAPGIRIAPQPGPSVAPAPDLLGFPLPDGIGDPLGDPFVTPRESPLPRPDAGKPAGNVPIDPFSPGFDPLEPLTAAPSPIRQPVPEDTVTPLADFLTEFGPGPVLPKKDTCSCAKKKKKKKKKSKPRDVCYRGTYLELRKGLSKTRVEQVPCSDKAPPRAKKAKAPRKPAPRTPTWQDTLNDVFHPQP